MATRLTGNAHDAEDLVQTALLKAARGFGGFRAEADARTWLYRILINAHRDRPARKVTEVLAMEPSGRAEGRPGEIAELEGAVDRAMGALPERQREAVVLLRTGMTTGQAAEAMGTNEANVRKLAQLGREKLREALAPWMEGTP